jgi:hypothetical protein
MTSAFFLFGGPDHDLADPLAELRRTAFPSIRPVGDDGKSPAEESCCGIQGDSGQQ